MLIQLAPIKALSNLVKGTTKLWFCQRHSQLGLPLTTIKMFGCQLLLCRCRLWRSNSQLCYTNSIQMLCMRCNQGWSQRHKASFVPCNKLGCKTLHNLQPDLYHLVNREPVARATRYGTKRISSWTNDGSRQISLISNYRSSLAELQYHQSMTRSVQPKGLVRSNYLAR